MLNGIFRKTTGVILLTVLLCLTGVFLVTELPIQLYPQTQRPRVRARINHTGVSALDFSGEYADEIEARLLAVDGVDILEVEYENDQSSFTLTFDPACGYCNKIEDKTASKLLFNGSGYSGDVLDTELINTDIIILEGSGGGSSGISGAYCEANKEDCEPKNVGAVEYVVALEGDR